MQTQGGVRMRTNKEKYDFLYDALEKRCQDFIRTILPTVPKKYYTISINYTKYKDGYFIQELPVACTGYKHGFYRIQKPTRLNIAKLQSYLDNPPPLSEDRIFLNWEIDNISGYNYLPKIGIADGMEAWTAEALEPKLKYLIDTYSPKEGHIACAYCRKQRKPEDIRYARIWSPNWKHQGGQSDPRPYCKDDHCAGYDQMGHEG